MKKTLFTELVGPTSYACPKCRGHMDHYRRPINVDVFSCVACGEVFNPEYVKGFEDGFNSSVSLTTREAASGNQAALRCPGCGELKIEERIYCTNCGTWLPGS